MEGDQVTLQDLFVFNVRGTTANGSIAGALESTGLHPTFKEDFHRRGIELPAELFALR
jgi:pilus assembly protein CpaF